MTSRNELPRILSQQQINSSMENHPRPVHSPIRIRHVFLAALATGLFCGLMIAEPMQWLVGVVE